MDVEKLVDEIKRGRETNTPINICAGCDFDVDHKHSEDAPCQICAKEIKKCREYLDKLEQKILSPYDPDIDEEAWYCSILEHIIRAKERRDMARKPLEFRKTFDHLDPEILKNFKEKVAEYF